MSEQLLLAGMSGGEALEAVRALTWAEKGWESWAGAKARAALQQEGCGRPVSREATL